MIDIIVMITGPISIICSVTIITLILRSDRGLSKLYYRIMFGLSMMDIIHSGAISFGTIPMPRGTEAAWKSLGTIRTCEAQGFFFLLGQVGVPMYNCSLCFYYFLAVKHRMREEDIGRKYEVYQHAIPIVWSILTAITALATKSINPDHGCCRFEPPKGECKPGETCRGQHVDIVEWTLQVIPTDIAVVLISYFLISMYLAVVRQERITAEYQLPGASARAAHTRKVWVRAMSYFIALIITYGPSAIASSIGGNVSRPLLVIIYVLYPLQGLYNLLIFVQTSVIKHREETNLSYIRAFILTCQTYGRASPNSSNNGSRTSPRNEAQTLGMFQRIRRQSKLLLDKMKSFTPLTSTLEKNRRSSGESSIVFENDDAQCTTTGGEEPLELHPRRLDYKKSCVDHQSKNSNHDDEEMRSFHCRDSDEIVVSDIEPDGENMSDGTFSDKKEVQNDDINLSTTDENMVDIDSSSISYCTSSVKQENSSNKSQEDIESAGGNISDDTFSDKRDMQNYDINLSTTDENTMVGIDSSSISYCNSERQENSSNKSQEEDIESAGEI